MRLLALHPEYYNNLVLFDQKVYQIVQKMPNFVQKMPNDDLSKMMFWKRTFKKNFDEISLKILENTFSIISLQFKNFCTCPRRAQLPLSLSKIYFVTSSFKIAYTSSFTPGLRPPQGIFWQNVDLYFQAVFSIPEKS